MQKNGQRDKIIVCAAAVVLAAVMLLVYFLAVAPKNVHNDYGSGAQKSVTLEIIYLNREYKYDGLDATGLNTVFDLLKKYDEQLELGLKFTESELFGSFNAYITSLKNTPEDIQKGYYYTYTINDNWADAVSAQPIADGDKITFKYLSEVWEEVDGEWVCTASELKDAFEPKTMAYIVIIIAVVMFLFAAAYITFSFFKSKRAPKK